MAVAGGTVISFEDRQRIRQAVNEAARERTARPAVARGCRRCGRHLDDHTPGCETCGKRHSNRRLARERR